MASLAHPVSKLKSSAYARSIPCKILYLYIGRSGKGRGCKPTLLFHTFNRFQLPRTTTKGRGIFDELWLRVLPSKIILSCSEREN